MSKASENDNTVKPEAQIPAIAAETLIAEPAEPASQPPDGWYFEFNNNAVSFTTDPEEAADIKRHLEPGETCTEYFKRPAEPAAREPVCEHCKGADGWEVPSSSTSYFWKECPACKTPAAQEPTLQCNGCEWKGQLGDTLMCGSVGPLCPECHETCETLTLSQLPAEPAAQESVEIVLAEVAKASAKFPTWPTDPLHAIAVLGEEFGELTKAVLQHTYEPHKSTADDVRTEAIQTAAMALRFLMSLDQYRYQQGEQHEQENGHASN